MPPKVAETSGIDLSVVVPAYNEARRLGSTLDRVVEYLESRRVSHEVLVVDDGSTDGTAALVEAHPGAGVRLVRQPENRGKGAALRRGVAESRGRRVLLCDADLSTPIEELPALERRLDAGAGVAIGSRGVEGSDVRRHQPVYRELMGKAFNRFVRLLGVRGLADTQCGFKLLDGEVARSLFPEVRTEGFAFDVELLWLARRRGHRVEEVGVAWLDSPDARVHPLFDSAAMLRDVVLMRWRHRFGR
ncbi:MAG TPA: dolichyl-phosphate beta-glucosyltransferase [Thermoanaerobaculia bacterium]|nr:dolichyl-phosphate beta-glucosyltransferase [Thermoanaerobaculia bacterium]